MSMDWIKSEKKSYFKYLSLPCQLLGAPVYTQIHGLDIQFKFSNYNLQDWIVEMLSSYQCPVWTSPEFHQILGPSHLNVNWIDAQDVLPISPVEFCEDTNDELEISNLDGTEWAFQRDFVGNFQNGTVNIFSPTNFSDSFFNALRWFMPRRLIDLESLVLHSSCFIDKNNFAHLFIGHSGVGKTTTVTRLVGHQILGDDMILISKTENGIFAETPILGQNPRFKGYPGTKFPIKAFHFLSQGAEVQLRSLSMIEKQRRFFASVLYPTWPQEQPQRIQKIQNLVNQFLFNVACDELTLNLSSPFLGVLDECYL